MGQVVYLDFDGPLHPDAVYRHPRRGVILDNMQAPGHALFEWASILATELSPYSDVRIVLSTSWVRALGYQRARKRLPPSLRDLVVGATYHSRHHRPWLIGTTLRGEEVRADVSRRRPRAWVAIDDTDEGWSDAAREHLVLCDSSLGLSERVTQERLRTVLLRHFG